MLPSPPKPPDHPHGVSRRRLLGLGAVGLLSAALPRPLRALTRAEGTRSLSFHHMHTGEQAAFTYWVDGNYVPDALRALDHLLRDHRTGEVMPIDHRLLDRLYRVRSRLSTSAPFHVISGFRSESTNEMLRVHGSGVARRSLHRLGQAIDVFVPDRRVAELRTMAIAEGSGGVGGYPGFVHLDVGPFRTW